MLKKISKKILPKSTWQFLRSKKIDYMVNNFEKTVRTGTYGGHELKVSIEDPLARGWYNLDWDRLPEIEELSKYKLKKGAKVLDLGAHQSVVAMMIAKEVGPEGKVLAIEANQHNYEVSCRNKELNGLDQLEIKHCAVGESNGVLEFSDDLNGAVKSDDTMTKSTKVNAYTVNTLIEDHFEPDVIFMDIEGFEVLGLKEASKAFELKCDWFVEVHGPKLIGNFGGTVQDVMNFFDPEVYHLQMGTEDHEFSPYDPNSELMKERFFLIATAK